MLEILKRNPKTERDAILKKAMKDTVAPFKIGLGVACLLELALTISWFIRYDFSNTEKIYYLFFYLSFVVMGIISLILIVVYSRHIKKDYYNMRILQTVDLIFYVVWAMLLTMLDAYNGLTFSFIIYCTFAVCLPMVFYVNRYVQFFTLLISQIILLVYCLAFLHYDFFDKTINFFVFCLFDDIATVAMGYTKMLSIKRELLVDKLSNRDALTELYNRQKLNKDSDEIMKMNLKNKYELTCIMMDIDNFKSINDTFGHSVGDIVIKKVAAVIKENSLKRYAHAYRYGGEEFLVIGSNMSRNQAVNLVEAIQNDLKNIEIEGIDRKITLSFGIYTRVPNNEDNIEKYYSLADELLYYSKNNGKDRYTFNGRSN